MTLDEFVFEIEQGGYFSTPKKTFLFILLDSDKIHAYKLVRETEKAFCLSLVSKKVYGGQPMFWIPKAAFKKTDSWTAEPLELKQWFLSKLDDQGKINIGLR